MIPCRNQTVPNKTRLFTGKSPEKSAGSVGVHQGSDRGEGERIPFPRPRPESEVSSTFTDGTIFFSKTAARFAASERCETQARQVRFSVPVFLWPDASGQRAL
jgi:hypothetical protein